MAVVIGLKKVKFECVAPGLEVGKAEKDIEIWEQFFLSEAQRGVTFAYLEVQSHL